MRTVCRFPRCSTTRYSTASAAPRPEAITASPSRAGPRWRKAERGCGAEEGRDCLVRGWLHCPELSALAPKKCPPLHPPDFPLSLSPFHFHLPAMTEAQQMMIDKAFEILTEHFDHVIVAVGT